MSASDDQKYANSLSQYLGGISSYTNALGDKAERVKKYNEMVNDTVTPIGDEFIRQAVTGVSGKVTKGLTKGLKYAQGKVESGAKSAVEKAGNIIDQNINITKKPAELARTLGRSEIDTDVKNDVGKGIFKSERFGRNFTREAPKDEFELADIAEKNRGRAQEAAQRSGQILEQDGGGAAPPDTRPPPAQPAPDEGQIDPDDGTRYFDADEPKPPVAETPLDTPKASLAQDIEEDTDKISGDGLSGDIEKGASKVATQEVEEDVGKGVSTFAKVDAEGGGPEDLVGDVVALGAGIAAGFLGRKLQKKAPPPPAPVITTAVSGAAARGI